MTNNKLKKTEILFLAAIILILLIVPGDLNFLHHGYLSGFMMQNWSVSYDTGFILRGLPGTIMGFFIQPISSIEVMIVNYVLLAFYIAFIFIAAKSVYRAKKSIHTLLFLLFILVQPPILQRWITSSTIGRLDALLAVTFISIIIILLKSKKLYLKYLLANLITTFSLLCHEGFAIFFVPFIFIVFLFQDKKIWRAMVAYLVPSVAAWFLIVSFGQADVPAYEFMEMLNQNAITNGIYPFEQIKIEMVYYSNTLEKVRFAFNHYNETILAKVIITFALLSPSLYCFASYWRKLFLSGENKKEKTLILMLLIASFTPLVASIFAIDIYRWIGWTLFNLSAGLVILYHLKEKYRQIIIEHTAKKTLAIIFASVTALVLGGFTVFSSYPIVEKYFPIVYAFFFG